MTSTGPDPFPDSAMPDSAMPDSAMDTGSDAGEPGERLGERDLDPDEERLLAELARGVEDAPTDDAPEDSGAALRAAEDEAPLPAEGGVQDDGLSPRFSSPE